MTRRVRQEWEKGGGRDTEAERKKEGERARERERERKGGRERGCVCVWTRVRQVCQNREERYGGIGVMLAVLMRASLCDIDIDRSLWLTPSIDRPDRGYWLFRRWSYQKKGRKREANQDESREQPLPSFRPVSCLS